MLKLESLTEVVTFSNWDATVRWDAIEAQGKRMYERSGSEVTVSDSGRTVGSIGQYGFSPAEPSYVQ